jgi:hypothetical protein
MTGSSPADGNPMRDDLNHTVARIMPTGYLSQTQTTRLGNMP